MSNNKLTDRKIAEILARAEICDDSVLTDYTDIAAAMRELQNAAGWTGYSTLSVRCVEYRVIIPITHKWLWHMSTAPSQCR